MEGINILKGVPTPPLDDETVESIEDSENKTENINQEGIEKSIKRYKAEKLPEEELERKLKFLEIIRNLPLEYISIPNSRNKNETDGRNPYTEAAFLKIPGTDIAFLVGDDLQKFGSDYVLSAQDGDIYFACMCDACDLVKNRHAEISISDIALNNDVEYILTRGIIGESGYSGFEFFPPSLPDMSGAHYMDVGKLWPRVSQEEREYSVKKGDARKEMLESLEGRRVAYGPFMAELLTHDILDKLNNAGIKIKKKS